MRREMLETYPPFLLGNFLSGTDNGRDKLIKARSGLGRDCNSLLYLGFHERFSDDKLL
jgi:hypothetical protein